MAQGPVFAKVSSLTGEAYARNAEGQLRRLKVGDVIREGESVVTADGAQVVLQLADGRQLNVVPGDVVRLDAEVAAEFKPDATDSAVANDPKTFRGISEALARGEDLDKLLEDPAAGNAGPGSEGHTFVEFARIVENVDPLSYQFATARGEELHIFDGGAVSTTGTDGTATAPLPIGPVVPPANQPPAAAPAGVTGTEDTDYTFTWGNFGVTDPDSPAADLGIKITSLPADGTLLLDGVAVAVGTAISKAEIDAGKLVFRPEANESGSDAFGNPGVGNQHDDYAQFNFKPTDATHEGAEATMNIDITPVADMPTLDGSAGAATPGGATVTYPITITSALTDTDGSETLSAPTVSSIPAGVTLSDGSGHTFTAGIGSTSVTLTGWDLTTLTLTVPAGQADFTLDVAVTSTETGGSTATATDTIFIDVPGPLFLSSTTEPFSSPINIGLAGEYFGYNDSRTGAQNDAKYSGTTRLHADDRYGANLVSLDQVEAIIEGRNGNSDLVGSALSSITGAADATFSANKLEFGFDGAGSLNAKFSNGLGSNRAIDSGDIDSGNNNLQAFLQGTTATNADSLVVDSGLGNTTDAIIRMVGYINIPIGGSYDFRITADDGYRMLIDGDEVARCDQIQSTATSIYTGTNIGEGLQSIEILYWDQGGAATLRIEVKAHGADDSAYRVLGTDEFALFSPEDYAALDLGNLAPNQEIVQVGPGQYEIRTGATYTGGDGSEEIFGSDGRDIIHGGAGNDIIHGGIGNDTIDGGAGNDIIHGGAGNDTLTGGLGADTFVWSLGDEGTRAAPARDVITDFDVAASADGGDVLDLRDLLSHAGTDLATLDGYLDFRKEGNDTVIDIRPTGAGGDMTQQIVLQGVDLVTAHGSDQAIIQDLLNNGKLLTD